MVKEKNIENKVTFIGEIDHEQVAIEMQQSNAFVLFSKHENFPCVIVEALCCGLPVVAANVGGVAEAVDKSNGIIVPSENVTELAHALNEVMKSYENFDRKSISTNALAKYDVDVIGKQFVSLYEKLLLN
jgi:glycosyltransferase involved in cell wall biosynthesis